METWQIVFVAVLVALPVLGMVFWWGDERLTFRGQPLQRDWDRQVDPPMPDADHH